MQVYVIINAQNQIYGVYKCEKTAEIVRDNQNKQVTYEDSFWRMEEHEVIDANFFRKD